MQQPLIDVGLISTDKIRIENNPTNKSFVLFDIPIGIGFHWEKKENQEFQGELKIVMDGDKLVVINRIPIEDYLTSVISSEMNAMSSLELLKAHAVISRSWLLAQIEKKNRLKGASKQVSIFEKDDEYIRWYDREDHSLFDVCADDHCQRYQGITKASTPEVRQAIKETFGELLMYNDEICDTRFSKCCGGKTESFEHVWENVHHPYLTSISDNDNSGKDFCDTQDKAVLAQILNDYDQETHDFYRWKVNYSQTEISDLIRRKSGWDFGEILDLQALERGESGRIIRLKIIGSRLTKIVGKELFIRKILSDTHLYSSAFEIEKRFSTDKKIPKEFILHGAGWGHGVGLCQIGAAMMAAKGYDYKAILQHYFPGTELKISYGKD